MKPRVKEVIVVEGRYDKNALLQVVDATGEEAFLPADEEAADEVFSLFREDCDDLYNWEE